MVNISSTSTALLGKTTLITHYNNPNRIKYISRNGLQGTTQRSRIPVNLSQQRATICNICSHDVDRVSNRPQPTVTNTSSFLRKKRIIPCTNGSKGSNCGDTNFKLQNPLNFTVSAYTNRQTTRASQCQTKNDTNNAHKNFSQTVKTITVNGVTQTICCEKPIVKVTNIPSSSGFLRTQYFLNNCLPPRGSKSINSLKIMQNKNCGVSNGGC